MACFKSSIVQNCDAGTSQTVVGVVLGECANFFAEKGHKPFKGIMSNNPWFIPDIILVGDFASSWFLPECITFRIQFGQVQLVEFERTPLLVCRKKIRCISVRNIQLYLSSDTTVYFDRNQLFFVLTRDELFSLELGEFLWKNARSR